MAYGTVCFETAIILYIYIYIDAIDDEVNCTIFKFLDDTKMVSAHLSGISLVQGVTSRGTHLSRVWGLACPGCHLIVTDITRLVKVGWLGFQQLGVQQSIRFRSRMYF